MNLGRLAYEAHIYAHDLDGGNLGYVGKTDVSTGPTVITFDLADLTFETGRRVLDDEDRIGWFEVRMVPR